MRSFVYIREIRDSLCLLQYLNTKVELKKILLKSATQVIIDEIFHLALTSILAILAGSDARTYDNSYSWLENSACQLPQDRLPNGSYNMGTNGTVLTYHCIDGFILVGSRQRYCLQNKTWSGQLPHCVCK